MDIGVEHFSLKRYIPPTEEKMSSYHGPCLASGGSFGCQNGHSHISEKLDKRSVPMRMTNFAGKTVGLMVASGFDEATLSQFKR